MFMVKNNQDKVSYALLSVFDKIGIVKFAKTLHDLNYKIISTGGTAKTLIENNIPVVPIATITGNPESFDGRMKTISFPIESGILYDRKNKKHIAEATALKIKSIDIVVCNFYPFEKDPGIENIDVGGPTMVRAAAKNHENVLVIVDPSDYDEVSDQLIKNKINLELRQKLAAKAFNNLSFYDSQIGHYLDKQKFPDKITLPGQKAIQLRYGENPHQAAALYFNPQTNSSLKNLQKLWGRDLSLINVTDVNAGIESVRLFKEPASVVIKHNTPCGIALGHSPGQSLSRAIAADPQSAFGGVIVINKLVDLETAKVIAAFKDDRKGNIDILAAPAIDDKAFLLLKSVRKSMGIYISGKISQPKDRLNIKFIDGGFILQTADDNIEEGFDSWQVVTKKKPTKKQIEQMKIAWKFITRIRSNTIIVVDSKLPMTRGIGSGQTSRIASTQLALTQARKYTKGAILASDSFFPFDDSVKLAAKYKIGAIVEQGGSINDKASIEAANRAGIPMIFTNRRAFWH